MLHFARLRIRIVAEKMDYRKSSCFQGVMMEQLNPQYAQILHRKQHHPYSQYITSRDGNLIWTVCTLNETAYEEILLPLAELQEIFLRGKKKPMPVEKISLEELEHESLIQDFYETPASRKFPVRFLTPTAFRQQGRYSILPDLRLICQSLMMRYHTASDAGEIDEDALEDLSKDVFVARHRIRSVLFPLEKTQIPGFLGEVSFHASGTETMARYLRLLLTFGSFAGVGIRTSMGMGAMEYDSDGMEENLC